jgi:hypothetical protein
MLQADGSPVAVGDFYMMICKGLVLKGKDRCLAEINECVLTGDAHGTFKAAAVVGSKLTNMAVKLIGSHEHMNRPSSCFGIRSWIGGDSRLNIATQCVGMIAAMIVIVKNNGVIQVDFGTADKPDWQDVKVRFILGGDGAFLDECVILGVERSCSWRCARYRIPIGTTIGASSFSSHKKSGSWTNCQDQRR